MKESVSIIKVLLLSLEDFVLQPYYEEHFFLGGGGGYLYANKCVEKIGYGYAFQFSSVAQSCATLCDPMDCSTPGLPVHHQLPEPIQTHAHQVGDAIHPSHPLSSPSPPALVLSQNQGLFQ